MKTQMTTETTADDRVGPSPCRTGWAGSGDRYWTTRTDAAIAVFRRCRRQWLVSVDGRTSGLVFESSAAAKRYAEGATVSLTENTQ